MTATLSADDHTLTDRDTRCRCLEPITPPTSAAHVDQGDFPLLNQMMDAYEPAANLSMIHTMEDLQGGLEEAERLLGYPVTREAGATRS